MTGSHSLAEKGIEELEVDTKESVDASEEMLGLCWGIIMFAERFGRSCAETMVVGEQGRLIV